MILNLDVVDDYRSKKKEMQMFRSKDFPFTFGDVSLIDHYPYFFLSPLVYSIL
jgi:hypothetical protein